MSCVLILECSVAIPSMLKLFQVVLDHISHIVFSVSKCLGHERYWVSIAVVVCLSKDRS